MCCQACHHRGFIGKQWPPSGALQGFKEAKGGHTNEKLLYIIFGFIFSFRFYCGDVKCEGRRVQAAIFFNTVILKKSLKVEKHSNK